MKVVLIFSVAVAVVAVYTVSLRGAVVQSASSEKNQKESPFYCIRGALNAEQLHRKEELGKLLHTSRLNTRELADGYEFELAPDTSVVEAAAEWATMERLCCPFFDIELRLGRENGPFMLRLSGRDGVKQFIHSEFHVWFQGEL